MARNSFYVTTVEVHNLLSGLLAPEREMYVVLNQQCGRIAKRDGKKNVFLSNLSTWRAAFKNVVGVERERAMWATLLDRSGKELCGRCGGAGGYHGWPGYTCFECDGRGWNEKRELVHEH